MANNRIEPIRAEDIAAVAEFQHAHIAQASDSDDPSVRRSRTYREAVLRWWLELNPLRDRGIEMGYCIRSSGDDILGTHVSFPQPFVCGDERLIGLVGSGLFVGDVSPLETFLMFRRYFSASGVDFKFATSCNASSGPLWAKIGGMPVPGSQHEYLLAFDVGPLVEEAIMRRGQRGFAGRAIGATTSALSWPLRAIPGRGAWPTEPCRDWPRLAELAEQCRNRQAITCDRSSAYLTWRYEQIPRPEDYDIHLFRQSDAREGWFVLRREKTGRRQQISAMTLMDVVWSRRPDDFPRMLATVVESARGRCHALKVMGRRELGAMPGRPRWLKRTLAHPTAYVRGDGQDTAQLAAAIDLARADGDTQ